MSKAKETNYIKVLQTSITKGCSGSGPVAEGGELPPIQPHIIVKLEGDEGDIYAEMSIDVTKNLRDQLSLYLK